ncbi:F0F1 ATP synthase subunit B family protein [Streptomyces himalayensis]|uniref:ATP synthase subunit b n=1 Tax=Streptomyces himalayensis subsp. himalayensis TaxID=2756131 RepID=A0A7W0I906_9ACTN|nr:F0F1 ATP synthase subunit B [Streptomyces himalayensis]MBA2946758.1 F0F1 ATP synthase subunit B [Streptomyces himalayensis subsp. himalayensis]
MNALAVLATEDGEPPLLPPWPETVVQALGLAIVLTVLAKKLLPVINKSLEDRRRAIETDLARAQKARSQAENDLKRHTAQLAEARHEAARLRHEAAEQSAAIIQEMRAEGQRQRESLIAAGHAQVEADREAAAYTLRRQAGSLVTDLAGRLATEALDDPARQSRVIDRFLDDLEVHAARSS